jgi:hypothetical protein
VPPSLLQWAISGLLVFRAARLRDVPNCRDHEPADGVYVPVLSELARPAPCDTETADERSTRLRLLGGSAGVAAAGLTGLAVIALRRRRVSSSIPIDRGFPR